jgi:hypothetical protein
VIQALERHRRSPAPSRPAEAWAEALSKFVAEHARNAGTSLYHLQFSPEAASLSNLAEARRNTVAQVAADPRGWLLEGAPTFVSR